MLLDIFNDRALQTIMGKLVISQLFMQFYLCTSNLFSSMMILKGN